VSATWHPESASKTKGRWDSEWPLVVAFPHRTWNPRQKENGGRGARAHQNERRRGMATDVTIRRLVAKSPAATWHLDFVSEGNGGRRDVT